MANATLPSGLMTADGTDNISKMKEAIFGTSSKQIPQPLNQRLGALTDIQRGLFQMYAKFALMMIKMQYKQFGYSKQSYDTLIYSVNKGMQPELKSTLVELLETIAPIEVREETNAKHNGSSIYDNPKFFPPRDTNNGGPNPRASKGGRVTAQQIEAPSATISSEETLFDFDNTALLNPNNTTEGTDAANKTLRNKLEASESSGRSDAEITLDDGRKFVGKLQFGKARLKDYQKATGTSFTQEEFKENLALQDRLASWHLDDLSKAVDELGDAAKGYSKEGLLAVGHLAGKTGLRKFVESKGKYNPSDALGTSAQDYYDKFSGTA